MLKSRLARAGRLGANRVFSLSPARCLLAAASLAGPLRAAAWSAPADEDARFADHVVMVLTRGADRAGFCTGVVLGPRVGADRRPLPAPGAGHASLHYRDDERPAGLGRRQAAAEAHPLYRANAIAERVVSIDLALIETETPLDPRFTAARLAEGDGPAVGDETILAGYGVAREGDSVERRRLAQRAAERCARRCRAFCCGLRTARRAAPARAAAIPARRCISATARRWRRSSPGLQASMASAAAALTQGPLIAPQRDWIEATLARWRR